MMWDANNFTDKVPSRKRRWSEGVTRLLRRLSLTSVSQVDPRPGPAALRPAMWPFWLTLILSLLISVLAWRLEVSNVEQRARQSFDAQATSIMTRIESAMDTYVQVLRGSAALFDSIENVTRDKWRNYVNHLEADQTWYGLGTIGFASVVSSAQKDDHIQKYRAQGLDDYEIWPHGTRGKYAPIVFLEPLGWQLRNALGFDLFSESIRRAAMVRARDTGKPVLSSKLTLSTEIQVQKQAGLVLFAPVYKKGASTDTIETRRNAIQGYAFKPLPVGELIGKAIGHLGAEKVRGVGFELFDGTGFRDSAKLYGTEPMPEEVSDAPLFVRNEILPVVGDTLEFRFFSLRSFEESVSKWSPLIVLLIGVTFSTLLAAIAWTIRTKQISAAEANDRIEEELAQRRRAERALRINDTRLRLALTAGKMGNWEYDVDAQEFAFSPEMNPLLGRSADDFTTVSASTFEQSIHTGDRDTMRRRLTELLADKQSGIYQDVYRIVDSEGAIRWIEAKGQIRRKVDGSAKDILGIAIDITERRKAEEREQLLMREVRHRGHNLLAVLQSIASQSLSGRQTLAQARQAFLHRLQSLARTNSILTDAAWEGAALEEIVRMELDAFSDRTIINGPAIVLRPGMAQTFALLLHELATNATKYGALSVKSGKVSLRWSIESPDKDARFKFRWQERNGPAVVAPTATGFGSKLLERVIGVGATRTARLVFAPKGLIYRLELPLEEVAVATAAEKDDVERVAVATDV